MCKQWSSQYITYGGALVLGEHVQSQNKEVQYAQLNNEFAFKELNI